jgi:hypothetical protein
MARKKSRQTFEKLKREQAVRERRARKEERKQASRIAKALGFLLQRSPTASRSRRPLRLLTMASTTIRQAPVGTSSPNVYVPARSQGRYPA